MVPCYNTCTRFGAQRSATVSPSDMEQDPELIKGVKMGNCKKELDEPLKSQLLGALTLLSESSYPQTFHGQDITVSASQQKMIQAMENVHGKRPEGLTTCHDIPPLGLAPAFDK